jgi:hypothetical protein
VAIILLLEEESVVPPQAASAEMDRPVIRPLIMVRFNFVSWLFGLGKAYFIDFEKLLLFFNLNGFQIYLKDLLTVFVGCSRT